MTGFDNGYSKAMVKTRRKYFVFRSEYQTECDLLEPIITLNSFDARLHDEREKKTERSFTAAVISQKLITAAFRVLSFMRSNPLDSQV